MKLLKNPVIALILAIVIVVSSTFISARVKLGNECQAVTDGFYKGVEYDGYRHGSIYAALNELCGAVSGLITIADNYDVNTAEPSRLNSELKSSISAMHSRISAIYKLYDALLASLDPVTDALSEKTLSQKDAKELAGCVNTIKAAEKAISDAGYNESVRKFTTQLGTLEYFFIGITGVELPEKFS